jgi:site-specific recombinase XerD
VGIRKTAAGTWEARAWIGDKRVSKTFTLQKDAKRWEIAQKSARELGPELERKPKRPATSLNAALDAWLKHQEGEKAPGTIIQRTSILRRQVRERLGQEQLAAITRRRIVEWQDALRTAGVSPIERNRAKSALSACLSWAAEREMIETNPALGIRAAKEPKPNRRALLPWEVEAIRHEITTPSDKAFVSVLGWCGLRVQEGLALRIGDIRPHHLRIRQPKTGGERIIDLPGPVREDLAYAAQDDLFAPIAARYTQWLREDFHPARERTGVEHATPAFLRHTYATACLYAGQSIQDVHQALGHSSWTTTLVHYTHTLAELAHEPRQRSLEETIITARRAVRLAVAAGEPHSLAVSWE